MVENMSQNSHQLQKQKQDLSEQLFQAGSYANGWRILFVLADVNIFFNYIKIKIKTSMELANSLFQFQKKKSGSLQRPTGMQFRMQNNP